MKVLTLITLLLGIADQASARDFLVPGRFATIQAAIDAAPSGATIMVGPGRYRENLVILKSIVLVSSHGAEQTILDGAHRGPVLAVDGSSIESMEFAVSGFSLTNDLSNWATPNVTGLPGSGAIVVNMARTTITRNDIRDNVGCVGSAIVTAMSSVRIEHNKIRNNTQDPACSVYGLQPSGILLLGSPEQPSTVAHNLIANNRGAGEGAAINVNSMRSIVVHDNEIRNNASESGYGGGIYWLFSSGSIRNNLLVGNRAMRGGGVALAIDTPDRVLVTGNVMLSNEAAYDGSALRIESFSQDSLAIVRNVLSGKSKQSLIDCEPPYVVSPLNLFSNPNGAVFSETCSSSNP